MATFPHHVPEPEDTPQKATFVPRMAVVPPDIVRSMIERLPANTDDDVRDSFGISWKTWLKIKKGSPVLQSLHDRLLRRLDDPRSYQAEARDTPS